VSATPTVTPAPEAAEAPPRSWPTLAEATRVDTCEREPVFLVPGENGSRLRLTESALRLLRLRSTGVTSEAIAEALSHRGSATTAEQVETRYQGLLERIGRIEAASTDNPLGFWFRFRLLPEAWVVRIAAPLGAAFRPRVVAVLLALVVAAGAGLAALHPPGSWSGTSFWLGYALLLLSVVVHELGHASACAHFGVRPSDIGATLYLIYPALYSDVSAAWELPRRQRVVVDLGGLYFQLVVAAAYAAAYAVTRWEPFWVAILMIAGGAVFSINPIFKFDGYWVVADSLGVLNLSRQPARIVGHYWKRLRGRPVERLPWSPAVTTTLAVYSILSFTIWGWFIWRMGPRIVSLVATLPPQVAGFASGSGEVALSSLLMSAAMAALTLFIAWRLLRSMLLRPLLDGVRRLRQRREAAPAAAPAEVP
jgi:putative peptide zinc metalloprotease protein